MESGLVSEGLKPASLRRNLSLGGSGSPLRSLNTTLVGGWVDRLRRWGQAGQNTRTTIPHHTHLSPHTHTQKKKKKKHARDEPREGDAVPDGVIYARHHRRGPLPRLAPHDRELEGGRVGGLPQGLLREQLQLAEERVHALAREHLLHHVLGRLDLVRVEHLPEPPVARLDLAGAEAEGEGVGGWING